MNEQNDHDILIEVKTIQAVMLQEIKELKDGTAIRLAAMEKDIERLKNFKTAVKTWGSALAVVWSALWAIIGIVTSYLK